MPYYKYSKLVFVFIALLYFTLLIPSSYSASGFIRYPDNPIFSHQPGAWDSRWVANPYILKHDGLYKMWYSGNNGTSPWKIGYAYSNNGINGWSRLTQPVIDAGSIDGWEWGTESPFVIYDSQINKFKMWYSSLKFDWAAGTDRYRIRFAESTDGINWLEGNWVLYGSPGEWDAGGPNRGIAILKINNVYHMWYAATNNGDLTIDPFWRIGYATSPDGINWTKQNAGEPVITPTESWELNNVSFPTVIYENGVFKMWYVASPADQPQNIVYAYSTNGIDWVKPSEENPVLTPINAGTFDSKNLSVSTVIHDNDAYRLYYSGWDSFYWRIGLATNPAISVTPTPFETPTPTSTPVPSHTPTPTPPPTAEKNKVLVIPGLGASWNADALLNCKLEGYRGSWSLAPYAGFAYNPIMDELQTNEYEAALFPYDWRQEVPSNVQDIARKIQSLIGESENEKVDVLGHSLGGLLTRAYISWRPDSHRVSKFLSIGSPHKGTPLAYPAWAGGVVWEEGNFLLKIATTILLNRCPQGQTPADTLRYAVPSVQQLLPTFDYLRDEESNTLKPVSSMIVQNNWLPNNSFVSPFYGVTVGTLAGTNYKTTQELVVKTVPNNSSSMWQDGRVTGAKVHTVLGDNTVLLDSSVLPGADNQLLPLSHVGLIASTTGMNEIFSFLGASRSLVPSSVFTEPQSALLVISYPAISWLTDPSGKTVRDTDNLASYVNPLTGTYKLSIVPKSTKTLLIVAQFLKDGRSLWKEYTLTNILPKFKTIEFNADTPIEDPLR